MTDKRLSRESAESAVPAPPDEGTSKPDLETADMQAFIGRQLRAVYDDIAKQPVPDRFLELMQQLDK